MDLFLEDHSIIYLWPDGMMEKSPLEWQNSQDEFKLHLT